MAHQSPTNFPVNYLPESIPVYFRWAPRPSKSPHFSALNNQCAGTTTFPPIAHETPVPFSPQYPSGFFARYCW